jgi:hypothetical protein
MGNSAAKEFGLYSAETTTEDSVEGLIKVVSAPS